MLLAPLKNDYNLGLHTSVRAIAAVNIYAHTNT